MKTLKKILWLFLAAFLLMNVVAFIHAYKFTHFADSGIEKTKDPRDLTVSDKLITLAAGVDNPRPINKDTPKHPFETIKLNENIESWLIPASSQSKGTVALFHGYSGEKSKMLDKARLFLDMGYNAMVVDFRGSGGSKGNTTTIGYKEAEEVKATYDYLQARGENKIYLFGTSMGAVAILKAIHDYDFQPTAIVIECPFGSMYETTASRFKTMNVPPFPMAHLLVFWGGVQNGFWAFGHKPTKYAVSVSSPALLLYGEKDEKVSKEEIETIFKNLRGRKQLKTYPLAGHENYLNDYKEKWTKDVSDFLKSF